VGAVHSKFNMEKDEMTKRVVAAFSNDYLTILAHPTGRKLEQREPYEIDLERVMLAAKEKEVCLELNAFPERMDLNDVNCRMAKEIGVKIAIGTDSHRPDVLRRCYGQKGLAGEGECAERPSFEGIGKLPQRMRAGQTLMNQLR
jgi:histidinol phosphatase-like PHP family hydrolase